MKFSVRFTAFLLALALSLPHSALALRQTGVEESSKVREQVAAQLTAGVEEVTPRANIVPTVTPLTYDAAGRMVVDKKAISHYMNYLYTVMGATALLLVGQTGEFHRMDKVLRQSAIELLTVGAKENNHFAIFTNISGEDERETIENVRIAEKAGADALVIAPRFYLRSDGEIEAHVDRLREKTNLPIILYNNPGLPGSGNISPAVVKKLWDGGKVAAIKDSSGDDSLLEEYVGTGIPTHQGNERKIVEALRAGALGPVGSTGNVWSSLQKMHSASDPDMVGRLQDELLSFHSTVTADGNIPPALKHLLSKIPVEGGWIMETTVAPGVPSLSPQQKEKLDALLPQLALTGVEESGEQLVSAVPDTNILPPDQIWYVLVRVLDAHARLPQAGDERNTALRKMVQVLRDVKGRSYTVQDAQNALAAGEVKVPGIDVIQQMVDQLNDVLVHYEPLPAVALAELFAEEEKAEIRWRGQLLKRFYPQLSRQARAVLLEPSFLLFFMAAKPGYIRIDYRDEPSPIVLARELESIPMVWNTLGIFFGEWKSFSPYHFGKEIIRKREFLMEMGILVEEDRVFLDQLVRVYDNLPRDQWTAEEDGLVDHLIFQLLSSRMTNADLSQRSALNGVMMAYPEAEIRRTIQSEEAEREGRSGEIELQDLGTLFRGVGMMGRPRTPEMQGDETDRYLSRMLEVLYYAYSLIRENLDFPQLARELGLPDDVLTMPPDSILNSAGVEEVFPPARKRSRRAVSIPVSVSGSSISLESPPITLHGQEEWKPVMKERFGGVPGLMLTDDPRAATFIAGDREFLTQIQQKGLASQAFFLQADSRSMDQITPAFLVNLMAYIQQERLPSGTTLVIDGLVYDDLRQTVTALTIFV
ncbi:MAG: dihydrodipicolinate synthase family protein [Candidatus Omnitrophica bacterium]|nr:dihydrodipicolinate synthase family protein [Candidatus Omnitrophota bacterium]